MNKDWALKHGTITDEDHLSDIDIQTAILKADRELAKLQAEIIKCREIMSLQKINERIAAICKAKLKRLYEVEAEQKVRAARLRAKKIGYSIRSIDKQQES